MKLGILLQGKTTRWTPNIVQQYKNNFPDAEILFSTWDDQDTNGIDCNIIKSKAPGFAGKQKSTVNFQIVGTKEGLKEIDADIILKCRSDQFIHNSKIFELYFQDAFPNRIMVPDNGTYETIEYRTSDFCQIATKDILKEFWFNLRLYDPNSYSEAGVYLTKNYVKNVKKDLEAWNITLRKYFCVKSFFNDFQIEWEKLNQIDEYQHVLFNSFPERSSSE